MKDLIPITNEVTMTSVEVVELINQFRAMEGKSELKHFSFMRDIRKELDTLETLDLRGLYKFVLSAYINNQNKEQPCYQMNRDDVEDIRYLYEVEHYSQSKLADLYKVSQSNIFNIVNYKTWEV